jgi:hypothetical protein
MPRPKPLSTHQAGRTLVHRLGPRVDRIRQLETRFGLRPYRVFLVWTRSQGRDRGDGDTTVVARVEVLPTPRVTDLSAQARRPWSGGMLPEGTVRVDRITTRLTADHLSGLIIPAELGQGRGRLPGALVGGTELVPAESPQVDFFWEVVEDGRGDDPARRARFRLFAEPFRDAGSVQWVVLLESASDPTDRAGEPRTSEQDVVDDDWDGS